MNYTETVPNYGELYTREEFIANVGDGSLTNWDGSAHAVKDGMMAREYVDLDDLATIPDDATHVMWFNK